MCVSTLPPRSSLFSAFQLSILAPFRHKSNVPWNILLAGQRSIFARPARREPPPSGEDGSHTDGRTWKPTTCISCSAPRSLASSRATKKPAKPSSTPAKKASKSSPKISKKSAKTPTPSKKSVLKKAVKKTKKFLKKHAVTFSDNSLSEERKANEDLRRQIELLNEKQVQEMRQREEAAAAAAREKEKEEERIRLADVVTSNVLKNLSRN